MRFLLVFLLMTTVSAAQPDLPKKDTTIRRKDGSEVRYEVKPYAVFMATYVNGKLNGLCEAYYKNGKLWGRQNMVNNRLDGIVIQYTPNGDTARIEEWKESGMTRQIIYYSNITADPQRYYLVSKKGFPVLQNGVSAKFDKTSPDSLIEEGPDYTYMWIKGERKLIAGEEAPKYVMIATGDKPGVYEVKGGQQVFFRAFTEGEKKLFMKPVKK